MNNTFSPPRNPNSSSLLLTDELLLDYKRCDRRAFLNRYGDPQQRDPEREFVGKLKAENQRQIQELLKQYNWTGPEAPSRDWPQRIAQTIQLMNAGVECIYRGLLSHQTPPTKTLPSLTLVGHPTLLVKQPYPSQLGEWSYIPVNVKLGKRPKTEYKVVAAFHGYLLQQIQGFCPLTPELRLRGGKRYTVDLGMWLPPMEEVLQSCGSMLQSWQEPDVFISRQRCGLCDWQTYCHGIAQQKNHLSLVPGITPSRYEALQALGIETPEELAESEMLPDAELIEGELFAQLQQQAQSISENRPLFRYPNKRLPPFPSAPIELYFDLEAEPDRQVDYLFGVLCVNHETQEEQFYRFLAERPEDEPLVWQQFLALIWRYPQAPIFHFSEYEVETVKRLTKLYRCTYFSLSSLVSRFVDIHHWIVTSTTLPVENYSLKTLAKWLGFAWRDQAVSGDQTVCLYDKWLKVGDRSLLDTIIRYNEDDCRATYHLKTWLEDFLQNSVEED
ncbi:TM0106 family RecB-like putative nuclease [Spirulina sp. CS-785/01]|uniref:TM0106 family RecB-like putative nuclease n=1 Tax=Spirulina sp. CS-785/01 TaxID=3021716 RepID=UPI00232E0901|nr:TM0106 family RecB-like putative nuclease [Spirulina sp. CS-785/01]MDB9313601.1 TM0106 family RecB-like putative nuclease [Spirulina sp. CS-785/01]